MKIAELSPLGLLVPFSTKLPSNTPLMSNALIAAVKSAKVFR